MKTFFKQQVEAAITIFKTKATEVEEESEKLPVIVSWLAEIAETNSVVITIAAELRALKFFPGQRIDFVEPEVVADGVTFKPYTWYISTESEEDQDGLHRAYRARMFTNVLQAASKGQTGIKIENP